MSGGKFVPLTPPVVIPGSSYHIQLGQITNNFYVRVIRGNTVTSLVPIMSLDPNEVAASVYSEIKIPMFNMFSLMKAVGRLLNLYRSGIPPAEISTTEIEEKNVVEELPKEKDVFTRAEQEKSESNELEQYMGEVKRLNYEEKWKRAVATVNLVLGIASNYIRKSYGDAAVQGFWDYYTDSLSDLWKRAGVSSFQSKIVRIIQWVESLGINVIPERFTQDSFVGEVRKCLFKERTIALKSLGFEVPPDFPCSFCWLQLSKTTEALGLSFKMDRKEKSCIIEISSKRVVIRL
ncbi:MAG: hypothetical protein ACTSVF_02350 [Candidatus Asgardarchaeia archaeon]